ncbi:MAG: Holliday junction branch migration protein RuvA [Gammaproteobacteria bacterium]|nr:Holliday junction branch migration protein RuvA [Gammaproteobacteria bacterium]
MIGFLRGTLVGKRPPSLILEVGGVGYEVDAPMSTFYRLPEIGQPLTLVTHLLIREDAHVLYGFSSEVERALFRNLLKVSGVGARIALGVLSGMSVDGFYQCIRDRNVASLTKIPGVGRKTAERLVLEMADRLPEGSGTPAASAGAAAASPESEAQEALLALGYKPAEVTRMLDKLDKSKLATEELIREALRRVHAAGGRG